METGLEGCLLQPSGGGQRQNQGPDTGGNSGRWEPEDHKSVPLGGDAYVADIGLEREGMLQPSLTMYMMQDGTNIPSS